MTSFGDLARSLASLGNTTQDPIDDLPEEWMKAVALIPGLHQVRPPPSRVAEYVQMHELLARDADEVTAILLIGFQLVLYSSRVRVLASDREEDPDDETARAAKRHRLAATEAARAVRLTGALPDCFNSASKLRQGVTGLHGLLVQASRSLFSATSLADSQKVQFAQALQSRQFELSAMAGKIGSLQPDQWTALRGVLQWYSSAAEHFST